MFGFLPLAPDPGLRQGDGREGFKLIGWTYTARRVFTAASRSKR
jgi:hypothetical protein